MTGAVGRAREIGRLRSERYVLLAASLQPRNPRSTTTPRPEIWTTRRHRGCAGGGRGHRRTSTGVSRYIKGTTLRPAPGVGGGRTGEQAVISQACRGSHGCPGPHKSRGSAPAPYPITSTSRLGGSGKRQQRRGRGDARRLMVRKGIWRGSPAERTWRPSPARRSGLRRPNDRCWCCPIPASAISKLVLFEGVFDSAGLALV